MDTGLILSVIVRWLHILSAVVLVGGILFHRFVLLPSSENTLGEDQRAELAKSVADRWRKWLMTSITLLLLTGVYNFMTISIPKGESAPGYHSLFGVKFLLAIGVFFLASVLAGRAKAFDRLRADSSKWLFITAVLALAVILISGILKNLG